MENIFINKYKEEIKKYNDFLKKIEDCCKNINDSVNFYNKIKIFSKKNFYSPKEYGCEHIIEGSLFKLNFITFNFKKKDFLEESFEKSLESYTSLIISFYKLKVFYKKVEDYDELIRLIKKNICVNCKSF